LKAAAACDSGGKMASGSKCCSCAGTLGLPKNGRGAANDGVCAGAGCKLGTHTQEQAGAGLLESISFPFFTYRKSKSKETSINCRKLYHTMISPAYGPAARIPARSLV
jgi:hypothetical protein